MSFEKVFLITLILLFLPKPALAILPPDIIFSVGSQIGQFYSIIAIFIGGVVGSVVLFSKYWLNIATGNPFRFFALILIIILSITSIACWYDGRGQVIVYEEKIKELENKIDYLSLTGQGADISKTKKFFSDEFVLYTNDPDFPFMLEIDVNRQEIDFGGYYQYYYLNGVYGDYSFSDVKTVKATSSLPVSHAAIKKFDRIPFSDLSTRDNYEMEIMVDGHPLTFKTKGELKGDFITRHNQNFTRYQSVTKAEVSYKGRVFEADLLHEGVHSADSSEFIFFPEYNEVDVLARQFVLWDETGNFYMIDNSRVTPLVPVYPSHDWLLYKSSDGLTKKSFESNFTFDDGKRWVVEMSDFNKARIDVSVVSVVESSVKDRSVFLVSGKVTDDFGTRDIGGILHLVR